MKHFQKLATILLLLLIAGLVIIFGPAPVTHSQSDTATPGAPGGKIAFVSLRTGNNEIYTMNPDGSDETNVSKNPANDDQPAWSPDGQQIAFISDRDGNFEICVMGADGSNQHCLTSNATPHKTHRQGISEDSTPTWSPDGQHIAFVSTKDGGKQIYVMNADGTNPINLSNNLYNDYQPVWSPDLKHIAFVSDRDGNPEICVMDASGFNQKCLTNNSTKNKRPSSIKPIDQFPTWSPDSTKIAFVSTREKNHNQIFIMNADGSNPTNVTNKVSDDRQPAFSPDGSQIVFASNREGTFEIFIMNVDGSNSTIITKPGNRDFGPAWAPNGPIKLAETMTFTPTGIARTAVPTRTPTRIPPTRTNTPVPTNTPNPTNPPPPPPASTTVTCGGNITLDDAGNVTWSSTGLDPSTISLAGSDPNGSWDTGTNGVPPWPPSGTDIYHSCSQTPITVSLSGTCLNGQKFSTSTAPTATTNQPC